MPELTNGSNVQVPNIFFMHVAEREWEDAEYTARKSQRDAELADTKAQAIKAEQSLAQLQGVVDTLRSELSRKAGAQ